MKTEKRIIYVVNDYRGLCAGVVVVDGETFNRYIPATRYLSPNIQDLERFGSTVKRIECDRPLDAQYLLEQHSLDALMRETIRAVRVKLAIESAKTV